MAAFNVVQKRRREAIAVRKRKIHGDPVSGKLHLKPQPVSVSGKRKRKLFKKWRREQKEAVGKGLITMQDVEMAVAGAADNSSKPTVTFPKIKRSKLKAKQLKKKGKNKSSQKSKGAASVDDMVE